MPDALPLSLCGEKLSDVTSEGRSSASVTTGTQRLNTCLSIILFRAPPGHV